MWRSCFRSATRLNAGSLAGDTGGFWCQELTVQALDLGGLASLDSANLLSGLAWLCQHAERMGKQGTSRWVGMFATLA